MLWLDPDDDPERYWTYRLPGDDRDYVQTLPNGDCCYLTENGCSIYENRPLVCRRFDCRDFLEHPALPQRIRVEAIKRLLFDGMHMTAKQKAKQLERMGKDYDKASEHG